MLDFLMISTRSTRKGAVEVYPFIADWFPNGKNSIRVRIDGGSDFVFTYNNWTDWCYETVESHIRKMRGGANMKC